MKTANQLFRAINTCRRLKDQPLDVRQVGYSDGYEYCPQLDKSQVAYDMARWTIKQYPLIERLIRKWI